MTPSVLPTQARFTLSGGLVFDGESEQPVQTSVHVVDGAIAGLGDGLPTADQTIDVTGKLIAPGLIDAHFHAYGVSLSGQQIDATAPGYLALQAARRLSAALRRGFTTVRDVAGGDPWLAKAVTDGLIDGPEYLYTGPALSQTGGHGDARPALVAGPGDPAPAAADCCGAGGSGVMGEVVDGVDALRRAVRERFRRGAHAIKIMASGGVISPTDPLRIPQYSPDEIAAVVAEAQRRGSYVAAHAYSPAAIAACLDAGVRSIEHGNLLDAATAERMAQTGAFLVPTLVTYDAMARRGTDFGMTVAALAKNAEVLDHGRTAIELAAAQGVRVGFGTDLMGPLDSEQSAGLRLQSDVTGVAATLRSATGVNARLLNRDDLGRIRPGARADLVVFDGNPFQTAEVLWSPPLAVYRAGRPVAQ
ncbi:metal-dependent hydrolase family protein [Nakamurella aerolata]|uniref:Amidohydrolase family protein n=1 Tax=Nakamurella aerolata TaxID=1656892 RepID=A0A849A0T2_9ACTN|nr:amidohydrolase family protein [Nakamurella aerolata]NNG34249.1 amidohydrolase family protein [Nakamurella aerolata]